MRNISALFLSLLALPLSAAITGSVMTTGGQPIAGARVSIYAMELPEARYARLLSAAPERVALASAEADAKGNFSIASPKEAVVEVHVQARGYEPAAWLAENADDLGAVALVERPMRSGTVTSGGKPVANALVVISYSAVFSTAGAEYRTRTDAQGRYEAPEVKSPAGAIFVIHPDFAIEAGLSAMSRPAPRDMNVALAPGTALTGRTVAADGKSPVPNAVILLDGWPLAKSGEDGTFTIARAPQKWAYLAARMDTLTGFQLAAKQRNAVIRMEKLETISGRVVDAQTKRPVAGAMVHLMRSSSGPPFFGLTDAKGTFAIAAAASEYRVGAFHPAYGEPVSPVSVSSGQRVANDLSLIRVARASGVVLDEEKRPVPGAVVAAQEGMNPGAAMRFMRHLSATSAADGRFSVRVQPDAEVRLRAAKPGLPTAKSAPMKLAPGERKTGIVLTIATGIAVTGRVVDANDEPLSDVAVLPTETPTRGWGGSSSSSGPIDEDAVRTAKDGTFSLRLEAGTYDFAFRREGFAPGLVRAQRIAADEAPPIVAKLEPTVAITGRITRGGAPVAGVTIHAFSGGGSAQSAEDGSFTVGGLAPGMTNLMLRRHGELLREDRRIAAPARDVLIELPVGITVAGRVTDKATRSAVREFELGIERPARGSTGWSPNTQRFTSDDGAFTLEHVQPGAMQLVAKARGYATARLGIDAQEGKAVTGVALELDRAARLTGRITAENGSPLSDVSVQFQPQGGFSGTLPRGTTNANGEYVVDDLDPGERVFRITHPKYTPVHRTVTLTDGETRLDVQLSAGHRVTGTVVDEHGNRVAEAEVRAATYGPGKPALTNAAGMFEMEALPPGRYRFVASKRGLAEGVLEDVDVAGSGPLTITLRTGGTVYGRVSGLTAAELPHATVRTHGDGVSLSSPVDPQGNYRIEGLPAGKVSIAASVMPPASRSSRGSPRRDVQVIAGSSLQVDIQLGGDAVVRGRVTRNGVPFVDGYVSFDGREGAPQGGSQTDHEGRYTVSGLADGEYGVSVSEMRAGRTYNTKYSVRGSGTFDIDFKTGSVRGRVVDAPTGDPLANITVRVQGRHGSPFTMVTDASGTFTAPYLSPATYTVSASGDGYAIQRREIAVRDVAAEEVELRLTKSAMTVLRVVDARDGHPLSAPTTVVDMQGRPVLDNAYRSGAVDPEQGLKLPLPPGTYTARITATGYAPRSVTITAPSSPTVALTPGGTIRIQSKHAVPRRIKVSGPDVSMARELRPGENVFAHLAPGTYTIQLLNEARGVEDTVQAVVREGETARVGI